MRNAPNGLGALAETAGVVTESVPHPADKSAHRCAMCPLCRCHHDCRPELVEAVSAHG